MDTVNVFGFLLLLHFIAGDVVPTEDFAFSLELEANDQYWMFWKFDDNTITFELHVATLGWVGFGLSPNGGMAGSDIVMGYVKDGNVTFTDRYATGNSHPIEDKDQDWQLISGSEDDTYTVLKFWRPLSTCDFDYDNHITESTMRIIWSYHPDDPVSLDSASMHSARGSRSLYLLNHQTEEPSIPDDTFAIDLVVYQVAVPEQETVYYCKMFAVPDPDTPKHIVRLEPIVEPGNELVVHHIVLYLCEDDLTEEEASSEALCYQSDMADLNQCRNTMYAWAVGGGDYFFPDHVGFPVGGSKARYIQMEIHYNNAGEASGIVDSSGMRMYMSETLREYDGTTTYVGVTVSPYQLIPPNVEKFQSDGYCSSQCLDTVLGDDEIHIFSVLLHTHTAGTGVRLRHFRDGVELPLIAVDDNYDFNYQETKTLPSEVTVKGGDILKVECIYDTSDRDTPVYGGAGTQEEMCMVFINYYPDVALYSCTSVIEPHAMAGYYDLEIEYDADYDPIISSGEYEGENLLDLLYYAPWEEAYMPIITQALATQGPFVTDCRKTQSDIYPSMWTIQTVPDVVELSDPVAVCVDGQVIWVTSSASSIYPAFLILSIISICLLGYINP